MDDVIKVHPAAAADYTHLLGSCASQLDEIANTALNALSASPEFFTTEAASMSYSDAQNLIIQGIQEGKDVITQHGGAVDTAVSDYVATDAGSAQGFMV